MLKSLPSFTETASFDRLMSRALVSLAVVTAFLLFGAYLAFMTGGLDSKAALTHVTFVGAYGALLAIIAILVSLTGIAVVVAALATPRDTMGATLGGLVSAYGIAAFGIGVALVARAF